MSDSIWPWIILAVIVIVVLALLATVMNQRNKERRRAQAAELRNEAAGQARGLHETELRARDAEAEAERKRVEAERAEREAHEASRARAQEQAVHEDRLREADRLDPDVDHRAEKHAAGGPASGSHRVDGHGTDSRPTGEPSGDPTAGNSSGLHRAHPDGPR